MKNNEFWKPVLDSLGFPEEKHGVLMEYIQLHARYNVFNIPLISEGVSVFDDMLTLPLALKVLSELNLDKVLFVDAPLSAAKNGETCKADTFGVSYVINKEELPLLEDAETHVSMQLVEKTIEELKKRMGTGYLYVYVLFSGIKMFPDNGQIMAAHRFFTSDEVLEFNQAYLLFYLKKIDEQTLILGQKLIPEYKKQSFLDYIGENGDRVLMEDEVRTWFEKENIEF